MATATRPALARIEELLGEDASSLLEHRCETISREQLHLPGPDFVDRVWTASDRPIRVLRNLTTLFEHGRLARTGYLSILPVDQGIEHSAGASFAPPVRDLLRHMVGGTRNFLKVVEGEPMSNFDADDDDDALDRSYRDGAEALTAAWREDGVLERRMTMFGAEVPAVFPLNLQLTETALHSWDVATATDQRTSLDPQIAEAALAFTTKNMGPEQRSTSFGPEREAPPGAGPYERLAAFSGREVVAPA